MFLIVFITRYLDIFTNFHSVYNSIMKILYISCSAAIVYIIRFKEPWKTTNDRSQDTFLHYKFAIVPCAVLALIINQKFTPMEVRALTARRVPQHVSLLGCAHRFCGPFPSTSKPSRLCRS